MPTLDCPIECLDVPKQNARYHPQSIPAITALCVDWTVVTFGAWRHYVLTPHGEISSVGTLSTSPDT